VGSQRRAAAISRTARAVAVCLASVALAWVSGCSRSSAVTERPREPEAVVVYYAQLMGEHPLYPEVANLSARIAALTAPPDLRAVRALAANPLSQRLLGAPRVTVAALGPLAAWQTNADAALAAHVQEAEEYVGSWPQPSLQKTEARLSREAADEVRRAQNEAEVARMRAETRAIEAHRDELVRLRQAAAGEDREQASRAVDREVEVWQEIGAETEALQRDAETKLEELRAAGETEMYEAVEAARDRAEAERAEHLRRLQRGGEGVRGGQPAAVQAVTTAVAPAENVRDVPLPPDTDQLTVLLDEIEAAQRAAHNRRVDRLVEARGRLLRSIALGTQAAVRAVALRNGLDVRFTPETGQNLRDATDDFRPLLQEYWAARPAVGGTVQNPDR
jgi:hypothetical protein